jgi:alginate O-acetyltransferase complex protein AlgI
MAVGVSKMINIDLPINFDSPYKALSIRDFWKRWHISLTNFLTKYIYIPLGGSKKGKFRTYINTMIVFLISGIWHGANWTFILWGILHGVFSVLDRIFEKYEKKLFDVVKWCCTFLIINVLWLLFRSDSISQWWTLIKVMFKFKNMAVSDGLINSFVLPETAFILNRLHLNSVNEAIRGFSSLVFFVLSFGICLIPENNYKKQSHNNWLTMVIAAITFVWGFLCLSSESVFVYFNF